MLSSVPGRLNKPNGGLWIPTQDANLKTRPITETHPQPTAILSIDFGSLYPRSNYGKRGLLSAFRRENTSENFRSLAVVSKMRIAAQPKSDLTVGPLRVKMRYFLNLSHKG
jgi:hypothetical protein